jgi:hypothetical protein
MGRTRYPLDKAAVWDTPNGSLEEHLPGLQIDSAPNKANESAFFEFELVLEFKIHEFQKTNEFSVHRSLLEA